MESDAYCAKFIDALTLATDVAYEFRSGHMHGGEKPTAKQIRNAIRDSNRNFNIGLSCRWLNVSSMLACNAIMGDEMHSAKCWDALYALSMALIGDDEDSEEGSANE